MKQETILGWVVIVGLISHYFFGYFLWDKLGGDTIYSVTVYFNMDVWSFVVFMLASTRFLKGIGCLGMLLGTYFFYMEFRDPMLWNDVDYKGLPALVLLCVNLFFIWYFLDKLKNAK